MRGLRGHEQRRVRARDRGGARPTAFRRARPRAHDPARAGAGLEPPERHFGGLRRDGPRRGRAALRRHSPSERAGSTQRLTGHRFLFGTVRVGGSKIALDKRALGRTRRARELRVDAASGWRELVFNRSFDDRLVDVGVVRAKDARRLGATGPASRAAGVAVDIRADSPRLAYEGFAPVVPSRTVGDVKSRLEQRHLELDAVVRSPRDAPRPADASVLDRARTGREHRSAAARVESPRGATLCVVERDGDRVARVFTSERAPTRTGRWSRSPRSGTCSPTSRSSTRASSSATPAPTADADSAQRPPPTAPRDRASESPIAGAASPSVTSTAARATAASTSSILASSPYDDLQRFGIGIVASPRHADVLLVTGPVTTRMREPLLTAYAAMPEPRRVVALGDCALGSRRARHRRTRSSGPVEAVLPVDLRDPRLPAVTGRPSQRHSSS